MGRRRRKLVTIERAGRIYREPAGRFRHAHQARSSLGVWAVTRSRADRAAIVGWKSAHPFDPGMLAGFAAGLAGLIRAWSPILPPPVVVTTPPQGASAGRPYAAEALGRAVAGALGRPYAAMLRRTDDKPYHGPWDSRRQAPYVCAVPDMPPSLCIVVDDLATSGTTLRLALEAVRGAGIMAFGFAYSGV
jgi:hypothetical protein